MKRILAVLMAPNEESPRTERRERQAIKSARKPAANFSDAVREATSLRRKCLKSSTLPWSGRSVAPNDSLGPSGISASLLPAFAFAQRRDVRDVMFSVPRVEGERIV